MSNNCPIGSRWRHKKRGTTYEIVSETASLQCASVPEVETLFEDDYFIVYRSEQTGADYVRPAPEFLDGRFERLDTPSDV